MPNPKNPPAAPSSSDGDDDFLAATSFVTPNVGPSDDEDYSVRPEGGGMVDVVPGDLVPVELIHSALGPTFQTIFSAVASARGPHWHLQEFEKSALVNGWTPIVQTLLAKLGNSEQVMLTLAIGSTAAIVGGKIAQDATKRASSTASTKTPVSVASSASSASVEAAKQPEQNLSFETRAE